MSAPPALWIGHAAIAVIAVALPLLLPFATTPDSVFLHQLVAVGGWGLWLLAGAGAPREASARPTAPVLAAAAALGLCAAFAAARADVGQGAATAVLFAAIVVLLAAARGGTASAGALAGAWWLAGVACVAVALLQYFAPGWADPALVATSTSVGRAVGNLRQPNHLATALLCAMVWTAWLWQSRRLPGWAAAASLLLMLLALALSASRTGALALAVLLAWALCDARLPRPARWLLAATPLLYALCWGGLALYAEWQQAQFYAAERLQSGGDISSSRFAIWRDTLALIANDPWAGVGWGGFNFAWTFSVLPQRPVAFFDHTHNLPLQLAVEIGVPATALVLALLGWALWRARGAWRAGGGEAGEAPSAHPAHPARAALAMLAVLALHSLVEYPLWYAYFLLPAAWALGLWLGSAPRTDPLAPGAGGSQSARRADPATVALQAAGALMLLGVLYAGWDHRRVEVIFAPPAGAGPLQARIAEGRASALFGHHADYAAVTTEPRDVQLPSFRRPLRQLVDVRLLTAYIEALHAAGRDAEALYAAQRLREFRRDDAQAYFAYCEAAPDWRCRREPVTLRWRALRP